MPSMMPTISEIRDVLCTMPCMAWTASPTTSPPRRATSVAWPAFWSASKALDAFCFTVDASCAMLAAASSSEAAWRCVCADRSALPSAISAAECSALSMPWCTSRVMLTRLLRITSSENFSAPISSRRLAGGSGVLRLPAAICRVKSVAVTSRPVMERAKPHPEAKISATPAASSAPAAASSRVSILSYSAAMATPDAPRNSAQARQAQASMRERTPVRRHSISRASRPRSPVGLGWPALRRTPRAPLRSRA